MNVQGFDETYTDTAVRKKQNKKKEKKRDWLVTLSSVQLVLAVLGVLCVLALSKISPVTFSALRDEFTVIMQTDMSIRETVGRIRGILMPEVVQPEFDETASGSGGEDVRLYQAQGNICFAPFDTTVEMVVPVNGRITSRFGYRTHPISDKFGIHNGTDIAAPEGTAVLAALDGRVEEIGYNDVRGNYIQLSHGGETKTLYMHCKEIIAPEGAVVRSGEVIATVGSTGYSTGPHLHFSISVCGKYCNPEWLIDDV